MRLVARERRNAGPQPLPKGWRGNRSALDKDPLHVLHIGKTGGTALKHALLPHRVTATHELLLHGHDVRLADIAPGEAVMFTIRDPLSRFVSAFNGRLREDRPRYDYPWREEERRAFAAFRTPDELATALSSPTRRRRKQAEEAMAGIGHLRSSYSLWFGDEDTFRNRVIDLYFIAFQEQLDADFEQLKRKLRLPAQLRLPDDEIEAHRTHSAYDSHLSIAARANLERWYVRDLEFVALCRELAPHVNCAEEPEAHRLRA